MDMSVPFYRHQLGLTEKQAIYESIDRNILTSGSICKDVEAELRNYFSVSHAKLVNSWTNGALATLLAMDIKPGDEVIIPDLTFIACANVVKLIGAVPVFCDVNSETLLVDWECIKPRITSRTKAVMLVHLYGQMVDVKSIAKELHGSNIKIIEDCAHSFESTFEGSKPGAFSDVAIFSFYATKNITCGEGGAIITNNNELSDAIEQTVLHGMSAGAADRFNKGHYTHWNMNLLGTKANLPDILASLLPSQIASADSKLDHRISIVNTYDRFFENTDVVLPSRHNKGTHAHHLYPIWVGSNNRDLFMKMLGDHRIGCTVNFRPVSQMNYYKNEIEKQETTQPNSAKWGQGVLSLPLFPGLTGSELKYIIDTISSQVLPLMSIPEYD